MNSEEHRARASCRFFVLTVLATVVLAFILVLGLFHRPLAAHRLVPSPSRAQRH